MSIQVILNEHNLVSFRQEVIDQVFHAMGKIDLGSPFCYSDMTLTKQRHENHEEIARTVALVFVIVSLWMARFCWQWLAFLNNQLNQMFIKANQRSFRVQGCSVHVKNIFHAPYKLGANSRNAPFLLYVKLNSFFFTSFRTVSCEMLSTIFSSTNRSAKSCNVQRFRPSGGLL